MPPESQPVKPEIAYFAGGCFWGVEHYFQKGPGVIDAVSGYMQGHVDHPTYKQVCTDTTGHAETVKVTFDANRITYRRLLEAFFEMHDPTELNRQGPDVGNQYRSGIWTVDDEQKREAEAYVKELEASGRFGGAQDRHAGRAGEDVLARRGVPPGLHREDGPRLPRRQSVVASRPGSPGP